MSLVPVGCRVLTLFSAILATCSILGPRRAVAYHCRSCDPFLCLPVSDCRGGTTIDTCNCCPECAKVIDEPCGGLHGTEGRCDEGLFCVISPAMGSGIKDDEVGVCKVKPSNLEAPFCNDVICTVPVTTQCPSDSLIVVGHSKLHQCCPEPPSCACKPCRSSDLLPPCQPGYVQIQKFEGSSIPGNCCDIYECIEHALYCDHVTCDQDAVLLFNATCPDDSIPLLTDQPMTSQDSCCPSLQNGCTCKSMSECKFPDCPSGLQRRIRKLATGYPGSCCDQIDCINGSNPVCLHKGRIRSDGETWKVDECTTCVCQEGLTICEPVHCPVLQCSWMGTPEGDCCPVCRGCFSPKGELHLSGASWQEDSCVTCRCEEGQVHCQAQLCAITCFKPRTIPGQCCPECDEDTSTMTLAPHCPVLSNCTLMCSNEYVKGQDGCYQCKCNDSPEESCDLDCPYGFRVDLLGIEVCDCAELSPFFPVQNTVTTDHHKVSSLVPYSTLEPEFSTASATLTSCPPMIGCTKQCSYGYRKDKAGCNRCQCKKCPPFECSKKCVAGLIHDPKGCKLCKCSDSNSGESMNASLPVATHRCLSVDGQQLDEGQVWWDGCRKCFCHQRQEMCALIACPAVRCPNPVMKPGSCCLSCGGEVAPPISAGSSMCHSSDGRYFVEGETWQLDDCTLCICHQGSALCTTDSCPPLLCHQPVTLPHSCCPVCPDKDGFLSPVSPLKNPHRFCRSVGGTRYNNGDTWLVSPCQSCTCRDGQIHCFSQTCPILRCNKTFMKKNQCCPMCMDGSAKYCTYGTEVYSSGETWFIDECTRCMCSSEGQVLCMIAVCEVPKCSSPVRQIGACCAVCPNATENSSGDESLSGTNNLGVTEEAEATALFNRTLFALIAVVVFLILVIVVLLFLLFRRRTKQAHTVYQRNSKAPPDSSYSFKSDVYHPSCCPKPMNLDYKVPNLFNSSAGTASSKLSSDSLKLPPTALSCSDAKPSDSDESLLDKSFSACRMSFDDSIKITESHVLPTVMDYKVSMHLPAMDRLRIKHNNRHSTGDELEQTRHLLTATPSMGVTNNNRKSW